MYSGLLEVWIVFTVFPRILPVGTINFSACQGAGTIRGQEQNEGGVNITQQRMQSRVLACVHSATTWDPCCCQQWARLSQLRSLLGCQLPPFQALLCTRLSFMLRCESCVCTWSPTHLALLCRHYSRVGLILLSSTCARSAGSIWGREEIEEYSMLLYLKDTDRNKKCLKVTAFV